jgi:hypothetical protein
VELFFKKHHLHPPNNLSGRKSYNRKNHIFMCHFVILWTELTKEKDI